MEIPKNSLFSEETSSNSSIQKLSPEASPSLSQNLVDITKQILNWSQFGIDLNFAEGENLTQKESISPQKDEVKNETEDIPVYSLSTAQWTPKWPELFSDSPVSADISSQKEVFSPHKEKTTVEIPEYSLDEDQIIRKWSENIAHPLESTDTDNYEENTQQNDANANDIIDMDQKDLKKSSNVSFAVTDDSDTTNEVDKYANDESSETEQTETSSEEADVPTLILRIPPWPEDKDDLEDFDDLLSEIPSCTDLDSYSEGAITVAKKWSVEFGSNRNYIKALINYDMNDICSVTIRSKEDSEKVKDTRKFKWHVSYDNLNYIRSLLSPEMTEKVLKEELLMRNESFASNPYREQIVN